MDLKLNEKQLQAVECETSCLLIAGPGTGKTHTITSKLFYLLNTKKIAPDRLVALTFTRKSADEMKERLYKSMINNEHASLPFIGTIHAWCYKFLKTNHQNWQTNPKTIISEADQKLVVKNMKIKKLNVNEFLNAVSLYKLGEKIHKSVVGQVINYTEILKSKDVVDFDDLLTEALGLLRSDDRQNIKMYDNVLIDEFQDLNRIQFEIVCQLVMSGTHIFAVGDPYQSIYGFRGASPKYVDELKNNFNIETIYLDLNYRSSQQILNYSANLFNPPRKLICLHNLDSQSVLINTLDHITEAYWLSQAIKQLVGTDDFNSSSERHQQNLSFNDIAILYRTHAMARTVEKQLKKDSLPFQVVGEKTLLEYSEVKKMLELLEIKCNQQNLEISLIDAIDEIVNGNNLATTSSKRDNLNLLRMYAYQYGNSPAKTVFEEFLTQLKLNQALDEYQTNINKITLSTLHAAKGLEFSAVFVIGVEENLLPYKKSLDSDEQLEEEKRLLYVAMTRAKHYLYLTKAKKRLIHGQISQQQISRFFYTLNSFPSIEDPLIAKYVIQKKKDQDKKRQMKLF